MGEITHKRDKLEEKYKDVLNFDDLLADVKEFEKKLAEMKTGMKEFDKEFHTAKEAPQKKVRDF